MNAVLVINPGSTSTKMTIFDDGKLMAEQTIRHSVDELAPFSGVMDQIDFRYQEVSTFLEDEEYEKKLSAVVGRGGLLKPIPGGTYIVTEGLLEDLRTEKYNTHASNLGGILADKFGKSLGIPAFIVDPVVVDELTPIARLSGLKGMNRRSVSHALNQKAVARKITKDMGLTYSQSSLIVAHLGGGISIGAHENGKMIDVVNGFDGEGPYSPERTGTLPLVDFAQMIIEKQLDMAQVKKVLAGEGGIKSYLNETDIRQLTEEIKNGNEEVKLVLDGMCYQIAKGICEMSSVLKGNVNAVILTGGIAYSDYIVNEITQYVQWIAPIETVAGEMEMEALYEGALRVLTGSEEPLIYEEQ